MKAIILVCCSVLVACGVEPQTTSTATQGARCTPGQCDDGNGGGDVWDETAARAYITGWSTQHYGSSPRWGMTCEISADGSRIESCSVHVTFGGTNIYIDCTYPADGGEPLCLTTEVTAP